MNYAMHNHIESIAYAVLRPLGVGGVYARTALFERVIDGLGALISRHRESATEIFKFPPVMSRAQVQRSGYLKSFPHLLGCVSCLHGSEGDIRTLVDSADGSDSWTSGLATTDLVLAPAACYPIYPIAASRGRAPTAGLWFDVTCDCFRHEASYEIGRFQSFRMREYVRIGSPDQVIEFRERWLSKAKELADLLALPYRIDAASDPFFGRAGKLMAVNQLEQALKFELLIPVHSTENPTACMSFNYHRDHFGTTWGINLANGDVAHTGCVAFGMDRLALAVFATHGVDIEGWPDHVKKALSL
jgi:seryl-tRNA synthetase